MSELLVILWFLLSTAQDRLDLPTHGKQWPKMVYVFAKIYLSIINPEIHNLFIFF